MTDQGETTPAVWDPTARDGAGGWVRRPNTVPRPAAPTAEPPTAPAGPVAPPPWTGAVGDGPPLTAHPYPPTAPGTPLAPPAPPRRPPAAPAFPPPAAPPQDGYGHPRPQAAAPAPAGYGHPQAPVPASGGFPGHVTGPYPAQAFGAQPPAPGPYGGAGTHPVPPPGPYQASQYQPGRGLDLPGRYEEEDPAGGTRTGRRSPLLAGLGLVLLLAVGAGTVLVLRHDSSGSKAQANAAPPASTAQNPGSAAPSAAAPASPSDSPSASASAGGGPNSLAEAQALDALLTRGEAAKAPVGSAVAQVTSCPAAADIASAAQVFDGAAAQRDQLLADLAKLNLGDLPGGADAAQSLQTAWQQSGDIDRSYAAWARTVAAQGCGGARTAPTTPDKQHADDLNPQATQSKKDFVGKWNVLAGAYGLAARTWDRI